MFVWLAPWSSSQGSQDVRTQHNRVALVLEQVAEPRCSDLPPTLNFPFDCICIQTAVPTFRNLK